MSDSRFDHVYDPVATPNPAYDDDFEPSPAPAANSFDRRNLAQSLLARARARQEAIADAFVDALLDGKLPFFRILLELEQAALASEAEAQDARRPGLADILLPMLQRERAQAAANAAPKPDPSHAPQPIRQLPSLSAPTVSQPEEAAPPQPGITDIQSAAESSRPCRSRTVAHNHRRITTRTRSAPHPDSKGSPQALRPIHPLAKQNLQRVPQASILRPGQEGSALSRSPRLRVTVPLTLLSLTAVAAPETESTTRLPIRLKPYGTRTARRRISRCNPLRGRELHA